MAPTVTALFSSDGGQTFDTVLGAGLQNDGESPMTVPCELGSSGRIKLQSDGNIFFDINDDDLTVYNNPPVVEVEAEGGSVDDACQFLVEFSATATDACSLNAGNVSIEFTKGADNFTLGVPDFNIQQVNGSEVSITGSVAVSDLLSSPAELTIQVDATDSCGALTSESTEVSIIDDTPPEIDVSLDPTLLWPPNHKLVPIEASVIASDNCPGVSFVLSEITSNEPDNGLADGNTVNDIQDAELNTADLEFSLRSERAAFGSGRIYTVTYTAEDGSENEAEDSATVEVPLHP